MDFPRRPQQRPRLAPQRLAAALPSAARPGAVVERPAPSPADQLVRLETLDRLRTALQQLRPEEREVFLLRQNTDRTYDEIARLRRVPVGTVKTQMRSALQKLRKVLQDAPVS